jgi:hypothetical protein
MSRRACGCALVLVSNRSTFTRKVIWFATERIRGKFS